MQPKTKPKPLYPALPGFQIRIEPKGKSFLLVIRNLADEFPSTTLTFRNSKDGRARIRSTISKFLFTHHETKQ